MQTVSRGQVETASRESRSRCRRASRWRWAARGAAKEGLLALSVGVGLGVFGGVDG